MMEQSVSKQWRSWSDATFCVDWSGVFSFSMPKNKDAMLIWVISNCRFQSSDGAQQNLYKTGTQRQQKQNN